MRTRDGRYVVLLRGINVGGKNIIKMSDLAQLLSDAGYADVRTYIQSGNVVLRCSDSNMTAALLEENIEAVLEAALKKPITVVARSAKQLRDVVRAAPPTHGSLQHRSDVIFLKYPDRADEIFSKFPTLDAAVDEAVVGEGVIYFSRLDARATKSRLSRIVGMSFYQELTIRNWRTTTKLAHLLEELASD